MRNVRFCLSNDPTQLLCWNADQGIFLVDLQTGTNRTLVQPKDFPKGIEDVAWSPDGSRIAFSTSGKDIAFEMSGETYQDLWVMNAKGLLRRKLGHGEKPVWSPDGRRLLSVAEAGSRIDEFDMQKSTHRTILVSRLFGSFSLRWVMYSPDGQTIAVCGRLEAQNYYGLFLIDTGGRWKQALAKPNELNTEFSCAQLIW